MDIVILTNFRCGSHLLMQLIAENGFTANDEIIARTTRDIRNKHIDNPKFFRIPVQERRQLIKDSIDANLVPNIKAKLGNSVSIIHNLQSRRIETSLEELFPDAKFVHLTRNPFDAAISLYFARHTHEFFSFIENPVKRKKPVPYDFDAIMEKYKLYTEEWLWKELPQISATVDYDELVANPKDVMQNLGKQLCGKPFKVFMQSKYEKQDDPKKAEFKQRFIDDMVIKND